MAVSVSSMPPDAEGEPHAHERRNNPDNGREKTECLCGFPTATVSVIRYGAPTPNAAAVESVVGIDLDTKGREPGHGKKQVQRPCEEPRRERNQPYDTKQYGYSSDDLSVDPSRLGPDVKVTEPVEEPADYTGDHRTKTDFSNTEYHRQDTREDRHNGREWG